MILSLAVLLVSVTLCAGSTLPLPPEDNSHYVEGQSRYIWMPDDDGTQYLVDLDAPVDEEFLQSGNGRHNAYWLFTRVNPTSRQVLINGNATSIRDSNYRGDRPTKVIVHGWHSSGATGPNQRITSAFLQAGDVNVIVLDWSRAASGAYTTAVRIVPEIGRYLASFLQFLFETAGGNWNNVHLVGHSLGAHVVGNAGRAAPNRPVRVTGLDPAGPRWGKNANALNSSSAVYVEAIHTDGGKLGIMGPISHADFYPNGGRNPQPGCWTINCSHSRAYLFFASSVETNHFVARRCDNLQQARDVQCNGDAFNMGNNDLDKRGNGLFGLSTGKAWPF